jgi:glycosyltransferase involved in cell wall biosynthesis
MRENHSTVSVVIPVFMSAQILNELFVRLRTVLDSLNENWEIIMVDDGSRDGSYGVMRTMRAADPRVKIIKLAKNYGQHTATLCGLRYATGDYIITLDDDLQHPPEEIPRILGKLREGYHVVVGRYREKRHGFVRNIASRFVECVLSVFGKPKDICWSSFKGFSGDTARTISEFKGARPFLASLIIRSVPSSLITNIEVKHDIRRHGSSGYTWRKLLKLFLSLLVLQTDIQSRSLMVWGTALISIALFGGLFLVYASPSFGLLSMWGVLPITLLLSGVFILAWGIAGYIQADTGDPRDSDVVMIAEQER